MSGPLPRSGRVLLRIALTVVLLGLLLAMVDTRSVVDILASARPVPVLVGTALFLALCAISSVVWVVVLKAAGYSISPWNAFSLNVIGFFVNSVIPTGIGGDMWRGWVYARQEAHGLNQGRSSRVASLGASLAMVTVERWVAFGALAVLSVVVVPLAMPRLEGLRIPLGSASLDAAFLAALFACAMLAALVASMGLFSPLAERGRRWLTRQAFAEGLARHADDFLDGLLELRGKTYQMVLATFVGLASPLVEAVACWQLALAIGVHVDLLVFVVLTPVMRLLHHFPLTVDAAGVQDAALMVTVTAFGLRVEQGLALSLLVHAAKLCVSGLGLLLYLWMVLQPAAFGLGNSPPPDPSDP